MFNMYGCLYTVLVILVMSYEASSQNYYHTLESESRGNEFSANKGIPDLFGVYGNIKPPKRPTFNGNIQIPIPNNLYNYPVSYKPIIQEVPVKIMNVQPQYDNKAANFDLTSTVDTYLVENDPSNGNEDKENTFVTEEIEYTSNNKNNFDSNKRKNTKDDKLNENIENQTFFNMNETITDKVNFDIQKDINYETQESKIAYFNGVSNKDKVKELQLMGEPIVKIMNIGENLPETKTNINKTFINDLHFKKVKDKPKKIEITLPEFDATTIIVSSRNKDESSENTNEIQNKQHPQQQFSPANTLNNKRNLRLRDKAKELNLQYYKPLALKRVLSAYAMNLGEIKNPLYSYIYPYLYFQPKRHLH